MYPSFIIHAKLIGNLILMKYLMMDVSLVEAVEMDKILIRVLLCLICLCLEYSLQRASLQKKVLLAPHQCTSGPDKGWD